MWSKNSEKHQRFEREFEEKEFYDSSQWTYNLDIDSVIEDSHAVVVLTEWILYKNINWKVSRAEKIDAPNETFDYYTISFGLRNTKNLNSTISEAYRVLKKGGRFFCLEFSKIQNQNLDFIYKQYSKLIPLIGKLVVGKSAPYEYLVQSIDEFVNQEELLDLIKSKDFYNASYKNLSGGIVSLHTGWKIWFLINSLYFSKLEEKLANLI